MATSSFPSWDLPQAASVVWQGGPAAAAAAAPHSPEKEVGHPQKRKRENRLSFLVPLLLLGWDDNALNRKGK